MQASSEQDLDNGFGTKLWECCVLYCHQENVIPPDPSLPSGVSVSRYLSFSDVTLLFGNYSLRSARCLAILFSVVACLNISPLCRPTTMNTDEVFRTIRSQTTNRYDILRDFDNVVTTLNTVTTLLITGLSTPAHTPHTQHRLHDRIEQTPFPLRAYPGFILDAPGMNIVPLRFIVLSLQRFDEAADIGQ